jgi:hypothetical protein
MFGMARPATAEDDQHHAIKGSARPRLRCRLLSVAVDAAVQRRPELVVVEARDTWPPCGCPDERWRPPPVSKNASSFSIAKKFYGARHPRPRLMAPIQP